MKFQIRHESSRRIRVQAVQKRMTPAQADLLEAYIQNIPGVLQVTVHDRTCCAMISYRCGRTSLLRALAVFSYAKAEEEGLAPLSSSRLMNRSYEEKLVGKVAFHFLRKLYLPAPLRTAWTIYRSVPYVLRALRCLWNRRIGVELLDGISITASMLQGDFSTAGSVMFLLGIGELLEEWTHKKSVDDLARTMSLNVDKVWVKTPEGDVLMPVSRVQAGELITVHMGNTIPLDGRVTEGEVLVNQASLTGESIPVEKRPGASVFAGTVVEEGSCTIQVLMQQGTGRYDRIVKLIEDSEQLKSAAEQRASSLADHLVPYTLAASGLTWLATRNITRAVGLLMVDFSCALKLSMPLAVLSAMRESGARHITVKGGKYLEAVATADTIIFDKTGTLTHACPTVAEVVPFGGNDRDEMLRVAACLEEHFPHSMANAVVAAAAAEELAHDEMHTKVEYIVAHGIATEVNGVPAIIGSRHFVFEDEGCTIPEGEQAKFDAIPARYSHLYLAIGGVLAAVICITDPLRTEAVAVLKELKALGIRKTIMLTGDSHRTAAAIAAEVGADEFHAEVLPEDKARYVKAEQAAGRRVIMIGDGINDTPALSAADAGIAISDGAAIAREVADITIAADDLHELVELKQIADALQRRIGRNYRFVMGFNGGLMGLSALGLLTPATTALLHNGSTIAISLGSMTNLLPERTAEAT